jgi:hypothetical protein
LSNKRNIIGEIAMSYNYKKVAQKSQSALPKQIEENAEAYSLENKGDMNLDKMLEQEREDTDTTDGGTLTIEKQLDKNERRSEDNNVLLESKLNSEKTNLNEFSDSFRNDKGAHPMDYFKEGEKAEKKAYNAAEDKKLGKRKMDEIAGEQMIGEKTTIVNNEYKSQLLSNYDSREDFLNKNKSVKQASKTLFDADGLLFEIYKTASVENRELNDVEIKRIDTITNAKVQLVSQLGGHFEDLEDEAVPVEIEGDRIEDEMEYKKDVENEQNEEKEANAQNYYQWITSSKESINEVFKTGGDIKMAIDGLLKEAMSTFNLNWKEAESVLRDEMA